MRTRWLRIVSCFAASAILLGLGGCSGGRGDTDAGPTDAAPGDADPMMDGGRDGDTDMDGGGMDDAGPDDGGDVDDAGPDDGGLPDAPGFDAGPADGGPSDSGPTDAGPTDSGPTDSGPMDAGPVDSGPTDAGDPDSGLLDGGPSMCPEMDLGMMTGIDVATGNTAGMGDDVTLSCPSLSNAEDVAFTWTAPADGEYDIHTFGSGYDTALAVLDGASCSASELACNDDAMGLQSRVRINATAGTTYVIVVGGYDTSTGNYALSVVPSEDCTDGTDNDLDGDTDCADSDCTAVRACDTCPDQDLMSALGMPVATGDNTSAANRRLGSCGGFGPDVTFLFTAPTTAEYTISTAGSSYDTVLYVLGGDCYGREIACNDDSGGTSQSSLVVPLAMGESVVIVLDGFFSTSTGNYELDISQSPMTYSAPSAQGDLVINEIMQNPTSINDSDGEWLELLNPTGGTFDLGGCRIFDAGSDSHVIAGELLIRPGEHLPMARSSTPGFTPGYVYSGFTLANSDDEVIVECGSGPATEIDRVEYDNGATFPDPNGYSMSLDPASADATANDTGGNWCEAPSAAGSYDGGDNVASPGAPNPACP